MTITFKERVKFEAKAALQELLGAKVPVVAESDDESDDESDEESDEEDEEEDEDDEDDEESLTESLLGAAIVAGVTVTAVTALINNIKTRTREAQIKKYIDMFLPNMEKDILRLRQRAKMINSAQDIDSFEASTAKLTRDLKAAIVSVSKIELTERGLNTLSWNITSPEKRLAKFRNEIKKSLTDTIADVQDLETIAMQELNVKLGV